MKLKEAIEIARQFGAETIEDVDDLIGHLFNDCGLMSEQSFEEYVEDYTIWCELYHNEFPNCKFLNCKI